MMIREVSYRLIQKWRAAQETTTATADTTSDDIIDETATAARLAEAPGGSQTDEPVYGHINRAANGVANGAVSGALAPKHSDTNSDNTDDSADVTAAVVTSIDHDSQPSKLSAAAGADVSKPAAATTKRAVGVAPGSFLGLMLNARDKSTGAQITDNQVSDLIACFCWN